ncbi:MAG: DUF2244 domain-containing protein [Deltaproteobacteria bacterium]|nr:DUF2244 domain-containing protein [Deltaproteobacteria bacterium]
MTAQNRPGNEAPPEPSLFSAIITPHRSLSSTGFLLVMLLIGGTSFAAGLVFYLIGAWPVVGFLGLDVLLVYWAFRANYRAAGAFEQVTVTPSELRLRRVSHRGEVAEWALNPLWTTLNRETHEEFGLLKLFLVSRGRKLAVAGFLAPQERESFAAALSAALGEAKRGPTRTVLS